MYNYGFRPVKSVFVRLKKKDARIRRMPAVRYYQCKYGDGWKNSTRIDGFRKD